MRLGNNFKNALVLVAVVTVILCFCIGQSAFASSIVAWGNNVDGRCDIPAPNSGFIAVAGGDAHSLGLKSDGSIVAWGWNGNGQCDVPEPNSIFIAVAAGGYHSLGVKDNNSIVAWGWNGEGECDVPAPNSDFIAVAGGKSHSLGLKQDGSIVAWGNNGDGQCSLPEPNSIFIAIAAGGYHSLGIKDNNSIVVAWGWNGNGQCDVPEPNSGFIAIAAGENHSLGLKSDGSIVAWGWNGHGQCDVPEPNSGFIAVAAGGSHSLGLKSDGSIVAWGWNGDGQCNIPEPNSRFEAVAAGGSHSLAIKQTLLSYDEILVYKVSISGKAFNYDTNDVRTERVKGYAVVEIDITSTDCNFIAYGKDDDGDKVQKSWDTYINRVQQDTCIGVCLEDAATDGNSICGNLFGKAKLTDIGAVEEVLVAKILTGYILLWVNPLTLDELLGSGKISLRLDNRLTKKYNGEGKDRVAAVIAVQEYLARKKYN